MRRTNVDPRSLIGKALWCIDGPKCFPTLFCCKIKISLVSARSGSRLPCIWGYSVNSYGPGFRTLGRELGDWMRERRKQFGRSPAFYANQEDALAVIKKMTQPTL